MNKRIAITVMAMLCLYFSSSAQSSLSKELFSPNRSMLKHKFTIHLRNENKLVAELLSMDQLPQLSNLDSLVTIAITEIAPLQDSMQKELNNYSIIYLVDTNGSKKISITSYPPKSENFLLKDGEVSLLKIEQDTLSIIIMDKKTRKIRPGKFDFVEQDALKPTLENTFYVVTILVNNLADIPSFLNGSINQTLQQIAGEYKQKMKPVSKRPDQNRIEADYYPYDKQPGRSVYFRNQRKAFITLPYINLGIQNIYSQMATSAALGATISFQRGDRIRHFTLATELMFLFKESSGKFLQHRNDFTTFSYTSESLSKSSLKPTMIKGFSFAILRRRSGDYFEERTLRVGVLGIEYGRLSFQPQIIFNDLFKNASPSFKISFTY